MAEATLDPASGEKGGSTRSPGAHLTLRSAAFILEFHIKVFKKESKGRRNFAV